MPANKLGKIGVVTESSRTGPLDSDERAAAAKAGISPTMWKAMRSGCSVAEWNAIRQAERDAADREKLKAPIREAIREALDEASA